ncbi:hypothetical protein KP509_13G084700 [Ceratopteris richardii]|nr:hypothetical protein KP509_13G084700 [Ceratopteris richardii]KAH7421987.1 hypothetical protein KP509_13G084700 [Ceratopteris richardii]KAH7421988.1 hypothetical protein KP509_13G084700 [Ceratopteris richardii]KAH7421989.1 hypothetical protein KP509_13G084700 [Ceratopteris richardii]
MLQRYRRDRCELLSFLLSSSVLKKVVMPPGTVTLEDIDLEQVSVDYVLECARKNGVLELSEAIKKYHDDLNLPPMMGTGITQTFFLVTNMESSGPAPARLPPSPLLAETASVGTLQKSTSIMSAQSRQLSVDELIDDFEDDEDGEVSSNLVRRQLNDASDLTLDLPSFKTGLSEDDLRETAYEILLASVGAAGGLLLPTVKDKKDEKKSKLVRKLTGRKTEKYKPQPRREPGLAGLLENIRTQMEISESMDRITRSALLNASAGRVGKRMDTLLVPLELLCAVSRTDFPDRKAYVRWEKRQVNVLEEGLLNYPSIRLEATDYRVAELRTLFAKLEEAEGLPSPAGPAQHAESLRAIRNVALALAERASRGDQTGEVCHWADGYHLNVRLYERLLCSVFDILDEGKLVEEVDEIMELLKSTWRILGMTQTIHDVCYTWVLFRQFVLTGENGLLEHASLQMKRIATDSQRSPQERFYMKTLRSSKEGPEGGQELTFVESILGPIKQWVDKHMEDYHAHFTDASGMEALMTLAMVAGRLLADEKDQTGVMRMTSAAEMAAVAKQAEDYVLSSAKSAFDRALKEVDAKCEVENEHPLALLAVDVESLVKKDVSLFAPVISRWHPHVIPFSASLYHNFYQKELKPFLDGVSVLTDDVASVLPAADSLEQYLMGLVMSASTEKDVIFYKEQLKAFQVEEVSSTLTMRWVNMQLSRVSEWVDRTLHQEKWEPLSNQQRHGGSIVEVFRIMEETVDQFFNLKLPMRIPVLKSLMSGLDNALQLYSNRVVNQLGVKLDLVPPPPGLTRYGKETSIKTFTKKRTADPRLPDERRGSQLNLLTVSTLCVRLNTLHYILNQVNILEDNIKRCWLIKQPQASKPGDKSFSGISTAFDPTRKVINTGIDKICEFLGMKVIFWDLREPFIEGLYKGGISESGINHVTGSLDSVLGQICEIIVEPLRDRVVLGLLQASLDGMIRVLIDGGPTRFFSQTDANVLENDLAALKELFMADGEGLPRGVVDNMSARVKQIIDLYRKDARFIIESLRVASEQMMNASGSQMEVKTANDEYTLLRVLCHKMDAEASAYLKKQYKLPKSSS